MQDLAEEAGMKTSPFMLKEVLGEDCRMALSGLSGEASGLRGTVALLFEARLDEMTREGRGKEMEALLAAGNRAARDDRTEHYMVRFSYCGHIV